MSKRKLGRRELLIALATGAAGAGALTLATPATALARDSTDGEAEQDNGFLGAWEVSFSNVTGGPSGEAIALFTADGGLLNVQPTYPTAGLGTWVRDGGHDSASFRIVEWDYRSGTPASKIVLNGKVHSNPDGSIAGTYDSEVTRQGVVIESGSFVFFGTRIAPR